MLEKQRKKIKITTLIPYDLWEYLHENRQQGYYPSRMTDWIDEQIKDSRYAISNQEIARKIAILQNKYFELVKKIDSISSKLANSKFSSKQA